MKLKLPFRLIILFLVFNALCCSPSQNEVKGPEPEKVLAGAGKFCPENQKFSLNEDNIFISTDNFPNPALFIINKGDGKCANLHNIDHGGVFEWLIVNYNSDCIINGSTWILESIRVTDRDHMYFNLKSIDDSDPTKIFIRSNEGYSLRELNKLLGMQMYSCRPMP